MIPISSTTTSYRDICEYIPRFGEPTKVAPDCELRGRTIGRVCAGEGHWPSRSFEGSSEEANSCGGGRTTAFAATACTPRWNIVHHAVYDRLYRPLNAWVSK